MDISVRIVWAQLWGCLSLCWSIDHDSRQWLLLSPDHMIELGRPQDRITSRHTLCLACRTTNSDESFASKEHAFGASSALGSRERKKCLKTNPLPSLHVMRSVTRCWVLV